MPRRRAMDKVPPRNSAKIQGPAITARIAEKADSGPRVRRGAVSYTLREFG